MATIPDSEVIQHADGRIELCEEAACEIRRSPLYNEDLAPMPVEKRDWTTYNYATLWINETGEFKGKACDGQFLKRGTCVTM